MMHDDLTAIAPSNRLAVLAVEIKAAHEDASRAALYSAERALDAGRLLAEAKERNDIARGGWARWVEGEVGVPRSTADRYVSLFRAFEQQLLTIADIAEEGQIGALKLASIEESRRRRELSRAALPIADGFDYRVGDARVVLADIPDNSVPLILTDPPYGNEAEPLYEWLALFSERVLIPGGSLICYTGQGMLDRDIAILGARLKYWWLCMMPHTQHQKLLGSGVLATFKPVLWFVKGYRRALPSGRTPLMSDEFISPSSDKLAHAWAQGEGGVWIPIEHLTEPGELIVSPFAGTATWGRIAYMMGRRWTGADIVPGGSETITS
jgi:hypothetical protein